jgi:hypothetical protein
LSGEIIDFKNGQFHLAFDHFEQAFASATDHKGLAVSVTSAPILAFIRFAAKIAHGYAVAVLGASAFKPYLVETILDPECRMGGQYVGILEHRRPSGAGELHAVELKVCQAAITRLPGLPAILRPVVLVYLDLFLPHDLPTFEIVVGEAAI